MMRFPILPVIIGLAASSSAWAKGLDKLQAEPPTSESGETSRQASPSASPQAPGSSQPQAQVVPPTPAGTPVPTATVPAVSTEKTTPEVKPGLEKFYLATSLSWLNLTGADGSWHSGTTSDLEAGYRIVQLLGKIDLFGTFRYRPVVVDIEADLRAYRGIVESYLFGAKGHVLVLPKLTATASAELGLSQTHINSVDSLRDIDQDLEKSGVDLSLGAGISYLVLDKLGVGSRIALGTGAYKTVQIGLDIRFML